MCFAYCVNVACKLNTIITADPATNSQHPIRLARRQPLRLRHRRCRPPPLPEPRRSSCCRRLGLGGGGGEAVGGRGGAGAQPGVTRRSWAAAHGSRGPLLCQMEGGALLHCGCSARGGDIHTGVELPMCQRGVASGVVFGNHIVTFSRKLIHS